MNQAEPGRRPVLVVDDEPQMVRLVGLALRAQGFDTIQASSAVDAWQVLRTHAVSVVVLDVMMPGESGVDLCRRIRELSDVPIVLLTARGLESERVGGLEAGADDYVVKPFSPRELALRVAALARRAAGHEQPIREGAVRVIGRLRLEAGAQLVQLDDRQVRVSPGEFRLLWRMAERAGETVSWNELHAALGESSDAVGERELVRTAIYRLRGKLEVDSASPALILTHRGRGYRLVA